MYNYKNLFSLLIFLLLQVKGLSQSDCIPPVDFPMYLSGNFGELRTNHFHSGIDIKTDGIIGKKVFSIADGYVSRIYVNPYGFGKAIYITHPQKNITTVYGHLDSFSGRIAEYTENKQYSRKSFSVDLYPAEGEIPVKQGDLIALSGNSGSSGGPHLHFEVRDLSSGKIMNPITLGYSKVEDNIPPQILSVKVIEIDSVRGIPYHTSARSYPVKLGTDNIYRVNIPAIPIYAPSYFAIEATDRKNNVSNKFGIYSLSATRNNKEYFGFSMDKFAFSETRMVNTLVLYEENRKSAADVIRTYISPLNKLSVYHKNIDNKGVIIPETMSGEDEFVFKLWDDSGNTSTLIFKTISAQSNEYIMPSDKGDILIWNKGLEKNDNEYFISISPETVYESMLLQIDSTTSLKKRYSPIFNISSADIPVNKSYTLGINAYRLPVNLRTKAIIVSVNKDGSTGSSIGGTYENGYITAKISYFGRFALEIDSVKPRITPLYKPSESQIGKTKISFKITDNLSGIKKWNGYIDNKWALFDYDPKTDTITHLLKEFITPKGTKHDIKIVVTDGCDNQSVYTGNFIW